MGENPVFMMAPDFRRDDVWIPAFAGMTNSPQAVGNITPRDSTGSAISSPFENLRVIGKKLSIYKIWKGINFLIDPFNQI